MKKIFLHTHKNMFTYKFPGEVILDAIAVLPALPLHAVEKVEREKARKKERKIKEDRGMNKSRRECS